MTICFGKAVRKRTANFLPITEIYTVAARCPHQHPAATIIASANVSCAHLPDSRRSGNGRRSTLLRSHHNGRCRCIRSPWSESLLLFAVFPFSSYSLFLVTIAYTKVPVECYRFLLKTDPVSPMSMEQGLVVAHLVNGFYGGILPFKDILNSAFPGDVFNLPARKGVLRGQGF